MFISIIGCWAIHTYNFITCHYFVANMLIFDMSSVCDALGMLSAPSY